MERPVIDDYEDEEEEQVWGFKLPGPPHSPTPYVRVGVDIGQRVDPSAIVVNEVQQRKINRTDAERWNQQTGEFVPIRPEYVNIIRHVERVPIGTSYPEIAARIVRLVERLNLRFAAYQGFRPDLFVDITGVGRPVVDLLRQYLIGHNYRLTGVTLTGGGRLAQGSLRDEISCGKSYLVSRSQAQLQQGLIKLPDTDEARALAEELKDFEIHVSDKGTLTAGAKSGQHDDLVIALGLATLMPTGRRRRIVDVADL